MEKKRLLMAWEKLFAEKAQLLMKVAIMMVNHDGGVETKDDDGGGNGDYNVEDKILMKYWWR